jgi:Tfp pilus assembly PilM family ATPase
VPNLISKIIDPWYPSTAIGLERGVASVVHLEKGRGNSYTVRRAASFDLSASIIRPSFDEQNIPDPAQLVAVLRELATTAGLMKQKRWSLSLPEATTRTLVLTMETQGQSSSELQDVLRWKMERGFGATLEELSVSREKLQKDSQGRDRYLAIATRREVLAEYESLLVALGWRAGLILPRHIGESQWLVRTRSTGDSLLLSGSGDGFTAVIMRGDHPLIVRRVSCAEQECEDEFYRLLLFYRDRRSTDGDEAANPLRRMMVVGDGLTRERASEIVNETTGGLLEPLDAEDLGLLLPSRELSFDIIAAPAGLATLAF